MNHNQSLATLALLAGLCAGSPAALSDPYKSHILAQTPTTTRRPITIAVKEITNEAGSIWWWRPALSKQLTDMLATELKDTGHFTVVERQGLNKVLDEQALANSGVIRKKTAPKKGMVTGARYYILGSVSDYQENAETKGSGGGFSFMGFGQNKKKSEQKAYVAFDIRVVDTTTGEIAYTRTVEGMATSTQESKSNSGGIAGFSASNAEESSSKPPASKAIRAAMIEVSEYLDCILYVKDTCIDEYAAKNKARKAKTKDVLEF
jgi:curli biogenesis system outer membrane secretion channel CsgG